ncbi:asparagine synthase (glutamine-hydrolysing) [Butyrivibrio sp. Su6]|uniref:hypothetical protein n=1 Tax=Butyrivibrio sp. Su6 TaxID=1520810 RepID=UPI00089E5F63|nr:hypothetical protein [Butyrivibrio sp. Su6]SEG16844.1 asparagine synthase (glutamine-hydrolysing) [Butyrivibrio sp. Su6]
MLGTFAVITNRNNRIATEKIKEIVINNNNESSCHVVESENYYIARNEKGRFCNDQVLYSDVHVCISLEGVILNSKQLFKKYEVDNMTQLFLSCVNNNNLKMLLSELRGSFCGIVVAGERTYIFSDQFATKQFFYAHVGNSLIVSSEVNAIVDYFRIEDFNYSVDEIGIYSLLSYAFMYQDHTLVKEIKRLREGELLQYEGDKIYKDSYYRIHQEEVRIKLDDAIERIDELFTEAVKLQINKNNEYCYDNAIPLSAGMDCRMTAFVANKIADVPILNFSYSEYGQEDCVTPGLMARKLGNKWLFKSLDNGLDMLNIQESIDIADGLIYYLWPAQLNDFLRYVNTNNWGIVHTGVIGDVVLGCWHNKKDGPYSLGDGAVSSKLIPKLAEYLTETEKNAPSYEIGMFQNRAINGACMGYSTTFRRYCIDMSPFMNVDFFDFCLSLPFKYRKDHYIYYEWVKKKYPDAAKFKHNGITINGEHYINIKGNRVRIAAIKDLVLRELKRTQRDLLKVDYGMNPQEAWINTNAELRKTMDRFFNENKHSLSKWPEIYEDACHLYNNGNAIEKSMAISAVGSVGRLI